MGALMALILQIILGLVMKQKKEASKKITGLKNPSSRQINQAYQKLIDDIKKMYAIKLQVSKLVNAIKLNLDEKRAAAIGLRAYQESQYYLDRIIGNSTKEANFNVPISENRIEKVQVQANSDYIDCYFPFQCNSFKSIIAPQKQFLIRRSSRIYLIDKIIDYDSDLYEYLESNFEEIDYFSNTIRFLEIVQKLLCSYYNSNIEEFMKWYNIITDKFLNERNIEVDFKNYKDELFNILGKNKLFFTTSCNFVSKEYRTTYSNNYIDDRNFKRKISYSSYNRGTKNLQNLQLYFNQEIFKSFFQKEN
jgi:hypothetical protein